MSQLLSLFSLLLLLHEVKQYHRNRFFNNSFDQQREAVILRSDFTITLLAIILSAYRVGCHSSARLPGREPGNLKNLAAPATQGPCLD
jgi:hypothetical protein